MKYFEKGDWWLPDHEEHLQEWMIKTDQRVDGRLTYQRRKYLMALEFCTPDRRRMALDIGAHVGLWSWQMAKDFEFVRAFEPMTDHRRCFHENLRDVGNISLAPWALGEMAGEVRIRCRTPGSSGDTGVDPAAERSSLRASIDDEGQIASMMRLDDLEVDICDFMKIDCEGFELFVCRGAEETLKRCKPVMIVEQKPETGMEARYGIGTTDAIKYLIGLGARKRGALQGDYVMSW